MHQESSTLIYIGIILCSLIIISLCVFIVWFVYEYKHKQLLLLNEVNNLSVTRSNELLALKLLIKEETISNISKEIHDNVGQKLSVAKLRVLSLDNRSEVVRTETSDLISEVISDLRNLSKTLSGELIYNDGLLAAIQFELKQIEKINLHRVVFKSSGDTSFLQSDKELILLRIIQEGLQNTLKHARASELRVLVNYSENFVSLIIGDNGIGFKLDEINTGQGLKNIKDRCAILSGDLEIQSSNGIGTEIRLKIPIDANK